MTTKQKANELGNKFYNGSVFDYDKKGHVKEITNAKRCAIIAVNEMLDELHQIDEYDYISAQLITGRILYWKEVKQEIIKL